MEIITSIQNRIYEIRGERVMLDRDLANLYEVETKSLNLAVKRNIARFPADFMFQLTKVEWDSLRFQIETLEKDQDLHPLRLQVETLKGDRGQHSKYLPYAFSEQGMAMLSGILNSDRAIHMNPPAGRAGIAIMRAFVEVRRILIQQSDLKEQLKELKERVGGHDVQLSQIYDVPIAIGKNLLDEKAAA